MRCTDSVCGGGGESQPRTGYHYGGDTFLDRAIRLHGYLLDDSTVG